MAYNQSLEFPCTLVTVGERRQLVMSEMRMLLRPATTMSASRRAMVTMAAEKPEMSHMGVCFLKSNYTVDQRLRSELTKIHREHRQFMTRQERALYSFVQNSWTLNHQQVLQVDKPTSVYPETWTKVLSGLNLHLQTNVLPTFKRYDHMEAREKTSFMPAIVDRHTVITNK